MEFLKKIKLNSISKDLLYSVAGLCLMNAAVQFIVNPYLQSKMGSERFGVMLSLISIVSIVAISLGTSFNYSRMIASSKKRDCNSDYFLFLIVASLLSIPVCVITLKYFGSFSALSLLGYSALTVLSIFRYYGDVNFRLKIDFKGFFLFYFAMALGYIVGVALFRFSKSWIITYILAEFAAVAYLLIKGDVLKCNPFKPSPYFKSNLNSSLTLIATNLLTSVIANIDRPLILKFVDANSVTVFYIATLIGKIIALLTAPLNGVIISYLAKYDGKLSRKTFTNICAVSLIGVSLLSLICIFVSYIFVKIMYPNVYLQAKPLIPVAITGQIFYFMSGTLMVVLMRFTKERLQFVVNGIYFAVYMAVCIFALKAKGLYGFTFAVLFANAFRMVLTYLFGMLELKKENLKQ